MRIAAIIILLLFMVSCKDDNKTTVNTQITNLKEKKKPAEICDVDFDIFFDKFKEDSIFQKEHVKFPLKDSHLDVDYEKEIIDHIGEADYRFIDFKSHKDAMKQEHDKFTTEIIKAKNSTDYLMRGYDNGISTDIKFTFIDGCWYLTEIKDRST